MIEVGANVEAIEDPEAVNGLKDLHWIPNDWNIDGDNMVPEFRVKNAADCPLHRDEKMCNMDETFASVYWTQIGYPEINSQVSTDSRRNLHNNRPKFGGDNPTLAIF